jgi:hypothetical protein
MQRSLCVTLTHMRRSWIELLEEPKRNTLFDLIDTYIRDAKIRKAHAS